MNLYSGPATKVEIDDNVDFTSATDLGEAQDIQINWEPQGAELMDKSKTQNGGIGTLTMKLAEGSKRPAMCASGCASPPRMATPGSSTTCMCSMATAPI